MARASATGHRPPAADGPVSVAEDGEQFDFEYQPSLDRKVVRELAGLSFVDRAENVVLLGPPGVGKTHCDTRSAMVRE